jgi:hypothetical protein
MTTTDLLINRLIDEKIPKEEKLLLLNEFEKELKRYKSGDLIYFKDTAIPDCLKYFYNFYLNTS